MTVKVMAFDLDGTLLRSDKTVDPRTADAIKRAMDAGIHIVLASGRDRAGCEFVYKPLDLDKGPNYLALLNGQIVYDFANKEYDVDRVLEADDSLAIQKVCKKYGVEGIFCCGYDFYSYLTRSGRLKKNLRRIVFGKAGDYGLANNKDKRTFSQLPVSMEPITKDINKVCMVHSPKFFEHRLPELRKELADYDLVLVGKDWLEIMPKGVSKASGLKKIVEKVGCSMDEVMAFGDAQNDLDMIREAGIGVAMGNAMADVKRAADYVCGTNNDNGIGETINRVLAGEEDLLRRNVSNASS